MLNIDFYNIFININFDNILLEENNPLINSKEFYLNYKKIYFNETNKNYSKFLRINSQLQRLNNTIYKITIINWCHDYIMMLLCCFNTTSFPSPTHYFCIRR